MEVRVAQVCKEKKKENKSERWVKVGAYHSPSSIICIFANGARSFAMTIARLRLVSSVIEYYTDYTNSMLNKRRLLCFHNRMYIDYSLIGKSYRLTTDVFRVQLLDSLPRPYQNKLVDGR